MKAKTRDTVVTLTLRRGLGRAGASAEDGTERMVGLGRPGPFRPRLCGVVHRCSVRLDAKALQKARRVGAGLRRATCDDCVLELRTEGAASGAAGASGGAFCWAAADRVVRYGA